MTRAARTSGPLDARGAAAHAIADALVGRHFVQEALRELRQTQRLADREAGLASEIALGAVRHALTIEQVLSAAARFNRQRTPVAVRAILYAAAQQLIWLDRVPVFAAVDEAVGLARAWLGARPAGMVNAILRRLAGAIVERVAAWTPRDPACVRTGWDRACRFRSKLLPPTQRLDAHVAAAAGERVARFGVLRERYGLEQAESIAWASQATPPLVVQRHPLRMSPDQFRAAVVEISPLAECVDDDRAHLPPGAALLASGAFEQGRFYVQDATAHAAAQAALAQPGERVLDLCAAPGGKSIALAIAMQDRGTVVASDPDPQRLRRVVANVERLGLSCVQVRLLDDTARGPARQAPFDAVLVDAPCSNSGVIARRPEARLGLAPRKLRSLIDAQLGLLRQALELVRPGGRVVYSTCSIEPEENDRLVRRTLAAAPGWQIEQEQTTLPAWGPRLADWRDGGYWARVRHGG